VPKCEEKYLFECNRVSDTTESYVTRLNHVSCTDALSSTLRHEITTLQSNQFTHVNTPNLCKCYALSCIHLHNHFNGNFQFCLKTNGSQIFLKKLLEQQHFYEQDSFLIRYQECKNTKDKVPVMQHIRATF